MGKKCNAEESIHNIISSLNFTLPEITIVRTHLPLRKINKYTHILI